MENQLINYDDNKVLDTLHATVARGTTKEEFWIFINYCKSTRLNPLKNEVWCIKGEGYENKKGVWVEGRVQILTGINGYIAIANSHPMFDGMKTSVAFGPNRKPVSATCSVFRKDRTHPHESTVYFEEYFKPTYGGKGTWETRGITMIEKVAKAHALREAFPQELNGTLIEEEALKDKEDDVALSAKPSTTALPAPSTELLFKYNIPEPTEKTKLFFEKRGGRYDEALKLWVAPVEVEKDAASLAEFRIIETTVKEETWMEIADENPLTLEVA